MHRESIGEALLGTVLVFNTVFKMPESDPLFVQIFGASVVFVMLYKLLENARKWEKKLKKSAGRQPRSGHNKINTSLL